MNGSTGDDPEWWEENESIRERMGLPQYEPPRFEDGVYVHDIVPDIEDQYDVTVQFVGSNTDYGDDWELRVDFEPVLSIGRHRDEDGNTVFEASAAAIIDALETELSDQ
jgi:hypothetical protein